MYMQSYQRLEVWLGQVRWVLVLTWKTRQGWNSPPPLKTNHFGEFRGNLPANSKAVSCFAITSYVDLLKRDKTPTFTTNTAGERNMVNLADGRKLLLGKMLVRWPHC